MFGMGIQTTTFRNDVTQIFSILLKSAQNFPKAFDKFKANIEANFYTIFRTDYIFDKIFVIWEQQLNSNSIPKGW